MKTISLNGIYRLKSRSVYNKVDWGDIQEIPAKVPGNVEIALMEAGMLPDIYFGNNIHLLKQYEFYEWRYEHEFDAPICVHGERQYLKFNGVDCIADYYLNGEKIGHTENALVAHRFDVTGKLSAHNLLVIDISSPMVYAMEEKAEARDWAYPTNYESLHLRKAPSQYGWDIAPRLLSAGLWRDVILETEGENEILDIYLFALSVNENEALVTFSYNVRCNSPYLQGMSIRINGHTENGDTFEYARPIYYISGRFEFSIANPALWWPRGYGAANLYAVQIELQVNGVCEARYDTTFGIRSVQLVRTDWTDADGGEFLFHVNGQRIFCKGSNWVPADMLHSRDASRYEKALSLFCDTECNILRCWGGNVYEDHAFFDICDRSGIMVWQDFAMACASYPQTEAFLAKIRSEAESMVLKLRNHPSLILWSGDNECDVHMCSCIKISPEDNRITREVLPQVIARLDPMRAYLPSSPYISRETLRRWEDKRAKRPTEVAHPVAEPYKRHITEDHPWGARDYYKSNYYRNLGTHFISEIGYHGCCNISSIRAFISTEKQWPWRHNDEWITHASEMRGDAGPYAYRIQMMANQILETFGFEPDNLEDFALASQITQAEAMKYFIESTRMAKWRKTGIIWWNMIDGWPQFSDAVVSYDFVKKLAYYYIKRSQQPVCMMLDEPESWNYGLHIGNETLRSISGSYRVWDGETGFVFAEGEYTAKANETTFLRGIRMPQSVPRLILMAWDAAGIMCYNHYIVSYPPISYERYKQWLPLIADLDQWFASAEISK